MKSFIFKMIVLAFPILSGGAFATEMPPLAKKYQCVNCHAIDVKIIGPSWMDVSKAYNSKTKTNSGKSITSILSSKTSEEWLMEKISTGGAGTWGKVLMPPTNQEISSEPRVRQMVKDILTLSNSKAANDNLASAAEYYHCDHCHSMEKQNIGPSWLDISNLYNSNGTSPYGTKVSEVLKQKTPEEWLEFKVNHGGLGNWGRMIMPAMEYVVKPGSNEVPPDEHQRYNDMQELIKFIMNLAKK